MVAFNKLAAVSALIVSLAAAAPVRNPSHLDQRIKCLALGCTRPALAPPSPAVVNMAGSDASAERSENVKDFAETESSDIAIHDDTLAHGDEPETIIPDGLRILVKDDIIKKLLEEHVGDERKDVGHGEREMREQLEQPGVVEEHDDTTLMPNSHLSTTGSDEIPESAQPDETARNPPLKAEERLAYSLKSDLTELGHGKD